MEQGISYQTLDEFLIAPFGKTENRKVDFESKYQIFYKHNKIKMNGFCIVDGSYFIHIKIPSESSLGEYYDVVLQFFTTNENVMKEKTIKNYHIQFFSNSPSFVYKYATLYKINGYLIESLYQKYDQGMLDVLPEKTNSAFEVSYDKSIYYACRFMQDTKLYSMSKMGLKISFKEKKANVLFDEIQDTDTVKTSRDVANMEASIRKEIKKDNEKSRNKDRQVDTKRVKKITSNGKKKPLPKLSKISKKTTVAKKIGSKTTVKSSF